MFNKVILIAIFLIVGSQAQLQYRIDARFAQLVDQYSHNTPAHVQDAKQNVEEFVKGFVSGVASDAFFDQIKQCLADDQEVQHDIMTAIELIKTKNPEKVKEGIKLLGKAVEVIPVAANDCKAASADIQKFIDLLKSFTDPKSFLYKVGKSLIINHVEVIAEINHIIDAYTTKNYNQIGYWTGKAMATILLGEKNTLRKTMADFINTQNVGWTAEVPEQFATMTLEDLQARLMPLSMLEDDAEGLTVFDYEGIDQMASILPKNFDGRKKWGKCIHPIRDQAKCGSCWSFASTEVLSDRYCIASKGEIDVILSPQFLVSCNRDNHACNGGSAGITWAFLAERGTVQDQCIPYKSGNGTNPLACEDIKTCEDGSDLKLYNAIPGSPVRLSNPTSIKINLLKYGPVQAGFTVYEDFKLYKGGIYKHVTGKSLGGHAVKIVGWGEESGTKYWVIANSWTAKWGEEGFFKIAFGECGIDSRITAGQADLNLDNLNMSKAKKWF